MARPDAASVRIAAFMRTFRGVRVILDSDLAMLYGVTVKRLNEQVRRNLARFPPDFAFLLENHEFRILKPLIATLFAITPLARPPRRRRRDRLWHQPIARQTGPDRRSEHCAARTGRKFLSLPQGPLDHRACVGKLRG
ncbi:MAG: ORF6N domain-containing protein [Burkholderiales bacterium]